MHWCHRFLAWPVMWALSRVFKNVPAYPDETEEED